MTLLVHIGFHKTATTWLQEHLFAAPGTGFSVVAPDGRDCLYFGWELICGRGWEAYREGRLETPFDFDPARARRHLEELVARQTGVPVISNEDLSGHIWSGGFAKREIADRLHAVAPEAKILITIREQASLILSSYDHFLWCGGLASLSAYLSTYNEFQVPLFNRSHLLYDRTVAYYRRLFGHAQVLVLPFEDFRDRPQRFLRQLTDFAGVSPVDLARLGHETRANHNGPKVAAAHHWLRPLNLLGSPNNLNGRFAFGSTRLWRGAVKGLSHAVPAALARGRERRARATVARLLGDTYAASNARLAMLTGIDLAGLGYVMPSSARPALPVAAE
jgi:hypothetical protein